MLCKDSVASCDSLCVQAGFEVTLMDNREQEENLTQLQKNKQEIRKSFMMLSGSDAYL